VSTYDAIAGLYDPWSRSVVEDVPFYVNEALAARGPVVELGVGTGRIAVPTAQAGVRVIGIDSSEAMLRICRERGEEAGVSDRLDLRLGDLRLPPVTEEVPLVTSPFRSFLHLESDEARREALAAARKLVHPGGRFIFDVFTPSPHDVEKTHDRWLEREPGIWERAVWDSKRRTLVLSVRGESGEATMRLAWLPVDEWRALLEDAGFEIVALYGWFDARRYDGGEDMVWIARRPVER
jgi:SAM-dependent methyltransferase